MRFQVILHEGIVDKALRPRLATELRRIYADVFGGDRGQMSVDVTEVPSGRFFTAAKPSRTSLVSVEVPVDTTDTDRTRLLSRITDAWCDITGCKPNEVVVSAADDAS